jgi:hypothetical protein
MMKRIMERSLSGMTFNMDDIIDSFCKYGFTLKMSSFPDISFHMQQKFKGVLDIKRRENPSFNFTWQEGKSFTILKRMVENFISFQ